MKNTLTKKLLRESYSYDLCSNKDKGSHLQISLVILLKQRPSFISLDVEFHFYTNIIVYCL